MAAVDTLEQALTAYVVALLVASHDQRFLDAIGVSLSFDV